MLGQAEFLHFWVACHGFISANKEGMIEEHLWMSTPLQPVFLKDFAAMNSGFRYM